MATDEKSKPTTLKGGMPPEQNKRSVWGSESGAHHGARCEGPLRRGGPCSMWRTSSTRRRRIRHAKKPAAKK